MEFVHYGVKEFKPEMFKEIENRPDSAYAIKKPFGGFWASPVDADYGWKDWCRDEEFNLNKLNECFLFKLKDGARILELYDELDVIKLPKTENGNIDFEEIAKYYDAIYLEIRHLYYEMYGWDCDSLLVLNKDVILI